MSMIAPMPLLASVPATTSIARRGLGLPLAIAMTLSMAACQPAADNDTVAPATPEAATPRAAPTPATSADPAVAAGGTGTPNTYHWQCNEVGVASTYSDDSERVTLAFSGRELKLPIAVSASGARYADAAGNEFWTKGDSGTLTLAAEAGSDSARRECSRSGQPSSWYQAAARGIGFRAGGGEPGWFVEVERGETPTLRATLDYGERKIEVTQTAELDGDAFGYSGTTAEGTEVVLFITRRPCQDGMSGEMFEAGAKLEVGDMTYHGCGAFLFE